jgi:Fe-S cluster biogenesis protein NfuA
VNPACLYFPAFFNYFEIVFWLAIGGQGKSRRKIMLKESVETALEEIRPALRADGGDVELVGVTDEGVVTVKLTGACHGCPHGMQTLKMGIETHLKKMVPQVSEVLEKGD